MASIETWYHDVMRTSPISSLHRKQFPVSLPAWVTRNRIVIVTHVYRPTRSGCCKHTLSFICFLRYVLWVFFFFFWRKAFPFMHRIITVLKEASLESQEVDENRYVWT